MVAITTFDAAEHVLWRIREDGGTLHVETAGESMEFTGQYSAPVTALATDPSDLRFTRVAVGGSEPETSDTARFDDFNGGAASGQFCKTESLVSTFDGSLEPAWREPTGEDPCAITVHSGELRLALGEDPVPCAVTSSSRFDPQGSFFSARVRRDGNGSPGIRVVASAVVAAELVILSDQLTARVNTGPSMQIVATAPYDASAHEWLSMREQDGTLWFETSPDGTSWSTFASIDMPFPPAPVQLELFMAPGAANTNGTFDDVNVSGPSTR
ncbi:MAG: hypothetical protein JRI68_29850 [Deltaproteobacteria bacterium]|nr:hypothetical protein [Deltaproteobacteria bacterium]